MSINILISNQKGGVGKTTTAIILAEIQAKLGNKVCILELEPQTNASSQFYNEDIGLQKLTTADLFTEVDHSKTELMQSILSTPYENIYMFPGSLDLYDVSEKLCTKFIADYIKETGNYDPEYLYNRYLSDHRPKTILKNQLIKIQSEFDYIIIDSNPFKTIMNTNAMCASNLVLIPIESDGFSHQGLTPLLDTYFDVKDNQLLNPDLPGPNIFITRAAKNTTNYSRFKEFMEQNYTYSFLKTSISSDNKIKEATTQGIPPYHYFPRSKAIKDYIDLFKEAGLVTPAQHRKLMPKGFLKK